MHTDQFKVFSWRILVMVLFIFLYHGSLAQSEKQIRELMAQQTTCWNEGNLECFMAPYWKSDSLKFIGGGVTWGWQNTLNNYKAAYPTKEAMGRLTFDLISLDPVGNDHYFVVGQYTLHYAEQERGGHFSLLFKKIAGQWKIIADHSD